VSARRVLIVGSGASGVHFAETALNKGYEVTLLDVGREPPAPVLPHARFDELKDRLDDPAEYFLGRRFESVTLPGRDEEYYGIPPSKNYVFEPPDGFGFDAAGFEPLFSFARGGLAQAWTAGCYPFNDEELEQFPFGYAELAPHYGEVARRIGVTGAVDDLARFIPVHDHLLPPLDFDPHSERLLRAYEARKQRINDVYRTYMGRTRVATLSAAAHGRGACAYLGRCLWGCPVEALYTPSQTLRELERRPGFRYLDGFEALFFRVEAGGRVVGLVARRIGDGAVEEIPVERLALAAGTLGSAALVLRSVREATGEEVRLDGLMDNRQVLVPFLNFRMLGRDYPMETYQYHLLGLGIAMPEPSQYVHGQITTLKTALMHPVIQALPFDLRTSLSIARLTHSAIGVVNVNFHDTRRSGSFLALEEPAGGAAARLRIRYSPPDDEPPRMKAALGTIHRLLRTLGCLVPPGMQRVRPMGASVHYAGVFPMSRGGGRWTTTEHCESREFPNLLLVDGATFPFLPAKNLTFTLMANAVRVAEAVL
jgi:choline dehydrogenase-like flavoprotein